MEAEVVGQIVLAGEPRDLPRFAAVPPDQTATGHVEAMALYAGQSAGAVTHVEPAGDIVRDLARGAAALLARRAP
jgi:hypothetical protein